MSVRQLLEDKYSKSALVYKVAPGAGATTTITVQGTFYDINVSAPTVVSDAFVWTSSYLRNMGPDLRGDIVVSVRCSTAAKDVAIALYEDAMVGSYSQIAQSQTLGASGGELQFVLPNHFIGFDYKYKVRIANNTDTADLDVDMFKIQVNGNISP